MFEVHLQVVAWKYIVYRPLYTDASVAQFFSGENGLLNSQATHDNSAQYWLFVYNFRLEIDRLDIAVVSKFRYGGVFDRLFTLAV